MSNYILYPIVALGGINSAEFPAYDLPASDIYDYAKVVGVATINLW